MRRFDADKGLIHFTFANEDTYIKKSLVTLDRQRNLYYELKDKRYQTVFFVDLMNNNYHITCGDGAAAQLYERYKEKSGFKAFLGFFGDQSKDSVNDNRTTVYTIPREQKDSMLNVMDRIMSGSSQTAFVFSIEAMASFQGISLAEKILKKQSAENYQRSNLLLIVSDTHLDASFHKLTNPDGIFQTEAFPEIRRMCQDYTNLRLYDRMKQQMPGRISYMNDMEREELCSLVTLSILENGNCIKERLNRLEDYTDFLWLMMHSAKFSNQAKKKDLELAGIFPVNNKRRFSLLRDALRTEDAYEHMDALIDNLRMYDKTKAPLLSLVHADDTASEYQQYLYQNNTVLEQLNTIDLTDEGHKADDSVKNKIRKINLKLNQIRKELAKPYIISDTGNHTVLESFTGTCLDSLIEANMMCDYDTMTIAADALYYAICKCEQETVKDFSSGSGTGAKLYKGQTACIEYYRFALNLQKSVAAQSRKRKTYLESLFKQNEEQRRRLEQIRAMEKDYPGIAEKAKQRGNNSVVIDDYRFKVREYVNNKKHQESTAMLLKSVSTNLAEQNHTVATLLTQISSIEDSDHAVSVQNLSLSADEVLELMDKADEMRKHNDSFYQELSRLNKPDTDFDYERAMGGRGFNLDNEMELFDELDLEDLNV